MIDIVLKNATEDILKLIELTKKDIEDIKLADHKKIAQRVDEKNHMIVSFETNKSILNDELIKLAKDSDLPLEELMGDESIDLLSQLKNNLSILKDNNRVYAKFVVRLNEFYTSLFDEIFKLDSNGYEKKTPTPANILQVSA
jgi:hypothetical protein